MTDRVKIQTPKDILPLLEKWRKRREENFLVITLDNAHAVIKVHHISKGLANKTIAHPRECFFPAIKDYSVAVVFVHNHPGGDSKPSPEDDKVTARLCMAGSILGIKVLDHIIITPQNDFYSYSSSSKGKIKDNYPDYALEDFAEEIAAEGNR